MIASFPGVLLFLFGIFLFALRRLLAGVAVAELQKSFPSFAVSKTAYEITFAVVGLVFIVVGVLSVFQIIRFK